MRQLVSLLILSIFIFFLLCSTSNGNTNYNPNDVNSSILNSKFNNYYLEHTSSVMQAGEWDYYTDYEELISLLQSLASEHYRILKLYNNLGKTYEDRKIWVVKISDNPGIDEDDEPEVLFAGAHHGNELIGNEMAIYIIQTFLEGYGRDPRITSFINNNEIWVIPMPNPDGTEYTMNQEAWRKNRSPNYISESTPGPFDPKVYPTSYGVDLNRNYDIEWGDPGGSSVLLQRSGTYSGPEPFSELETQAIRDLVLAHNFSVYMDYHSGIKLILYPWGYTSDPTPDNALFERLGEKLSELTGYQAIQGYELYQTNGDAVDWVYYATRTKSFTVELSQEYRPDEERTQEILENNIKQPLYLTGISGNLELGSRIEIRCENIGNQTDIGPYTVTSTVKGIPELYDFEVKLYYKINENDYKSIRMTQKKGQPNQYTADIPTQGPDNKIYYYTIVTGEGILLSCPPCPNEYEFHINPSSQTYATNSELVAMIIMMIIILGFFWGGFAYTARLAMKAEQRKLHEYYYGY
jgi:hypothetical protein